MNIAKRTISGFTLLELLIVIAIIAIMSIIMLPIYQSARPSLKLSTTARDLVADLRLAQQEAVTQQVLHGIEFDITNNSYRIFNVVTDDTIKSVHLETPLVIATTTGLTASTASYNATGAATESGTIVITNASATSTIEIKPSGYVKIIE